MGGFRLIEHTADMGIEAVGDTLGDLCIQAARGLMEMIAGPARGIPREERTLDISAGDSGELLVVWLNEILFLFETQGFFPAEFEIEEAAEDHLRGRVRGEPFDPERHPVEREVKAVTYHMLKVEPANGAWRATVYVDL
jgi:SHS2 domain-containing protein